MKVRELIHALTEEWIDQNAEVYIHVYDTRMGESDIATVEKVTSTEPWGVQRVELELEIRDQAYWVRLWDMPAEAIR